MKRLLLIIAVLGLGTTGAAIVMHRQGADGNVPPVERAPYDPTVAGSLVNFYQKKVRLNPQGGAIECALLAGAYLQRFRQTGDPVDAQRAEAAARRSLTIRSSHNASARDQLAQSLFSQHQFAKAQLVASQTATRYPDDQQTWLCYAEAALERGDYDATERAFGSQALHALDQGHPTPSVLALQARFLEINGQPAAALALLRKAQVAADDNLDMSRPSVAWFHMRVGDVLAHMGRADEAERAYNGALAIFPQDYKTMTGLARLAAGRQDWPATISWGQKAAETMPNPEALALVGDAYAASGDSAEAARQYEMVDAFSDPSQGILYDRQRALFLADHNRNLTEALTRARADLAVRRDIYAYDTLAWACYKKGLLSQANAAMKQAMARHTQDALLFYHAGIIAKARGDHAQAKALLSRALAINSFFHPLGVTEARKALAGLG